MSVLIMLENIWCYREIYNAGKKFTLLPGVTGGTNLISGWESTMPWPI